VVYHKLPDKIANPVPLLAVLRDCRKVLLAEALKVKPMGAVYHGLHSVVAAIDGFATLLIRRPDYFLSDAGLPPSADGSREREQERFEREAEAGLRPWE
jgi:hypothetical protein